MSQLRSISYRFGVHFFLSRAWFLGNFWMIYLISKGFTLTDAAIMDIVFWTVILVSEIPTGYVADWFGRKLSVIVSFILQSGAVYIFATADTQPLFLLSYALWGFGITFQSGAEDAWIFDEIKVRGGTEQQYQAIFGRLLTVGFLAAAFSGFLSGPIATIKLEYTIFATLIVFLLDIIWLFSIPEHRNSKDSEHRPSVRKAAASLWNRRVAPIGLIEVFLTGLVLSVIFWFQIYLDLNQITYNMISIYLSTGGILLGIASWNSARISGRIPRLMLGLVVLMLVLSTFIMAISLVGAILGYYILHITRGLWKPYYNRLLNAELITEVRATSISIIGAISTISVVTLEYVSARIIETTSFNTFFLSWSAFTTFLLIPLAIYYKIANQDVSTSQKTKTL